MDRVTVCLMNQTLTAIKKGFCMAGHNGHSTSSKLISLGKYPILDVTCRVSPPIVEEVVPCCPVHPVQEELDPKYNNLHIATCYVLWGVKQKMHWVSNDRRVYQDGKPVVMGRELFGLTKEAALAKLDTEAWKFIRWW